jgi:hypothetical protein
VVTRDSSTEKHDNLIDRLKSINALFLQPDSSVIERYAGIAELALYKEMQKVEVLTLGLLDTNPQVRTLAAHVLARSYGMQETSEAVLRLLENEEEGIRAILRNDEQGDLQVLLRAIEKLLARSRVLTLQGAVIDHDRRHILVLLEGLGRRLRTHPEASNQQTQGHPLKTILEKKENRWILPRVFAALDKSKDVYCRRAALRVIGELDLEYEQDTPVGKETLTAFDLICAAIDREENRDDYLVTRDGLRALLSLTQQQATCEQRERFARLLRAFFGGRTYPALDAETGLQQSYLTRFNCMEMVQELGDFALFKQLLADGEEQGFLSMMKSTGFVRGMALTGRVRRAIHLTKEGVLRALQWFYLQETRTAQETISEQQQAMLDLVTTWIGSQDRAVPGMAIAFFRHLPNTGHALRYVLESARTNDASLAARLEKHLTGEAVLPRADQVAIQELLEDRKEFVIALGALLARIGPGDLRQAGLGLLCSWCVQHLPALSEQIGKAARHTRLEALWTLYDLTREESSDMATLSQGGMLCQEDIVNMLKAEPAVPLRIVLELLYASVSDDRLARLHRIATNQQEERLVACCAEIERIILTRGKRDDLSPEAASFIPGQLGHAEGIHLRLATRFLPVLSQMNGPQATALVGALLRDTRLAASLHALLLENLGESQCHAHYEFVQQTLWRTLQKRYPDRQQLRLSYLNLLRAGTCQVAARSEGQAHSAERYINNERYTPLQKQLVQAFLEINQQFDDALSPILASDENAQVIGLDTAATTDLHTFLYMASDTRDQRPAIRSYVRTHAFGQQTLVFLQRALTDTEIARQLYRALPTLAVDAAGYETATKLPRPVVGRVTAVTDEGAFVDIGLQQLRPFVHKEHLSTPDATIEDWQEYARNLVEALLPFTIQRITFKKSATTLSIGELELRRASGGQGNVYDLAHSAAGNVLQARVVAVDREHTRVIFQAQGQHLAVALEDLSWNTSLAWTEQGWQTYFQQRSGQTYELIWREGVWSLKASQPYAEYFSQLIYHKGLSPFPLVYVAQVESGHLFEIEPGRACCIPAERLLDHRSLALAQEVQPVFLLPSRTLGTGDLLEVCFKEAAIEGKSELVLQVSRIEEDKLTNDRLRPGMKFTGKLVAWQRAEGRGLLEDVRGLEGYTVTITQLPGEDPLLSQPIEEGCDVSGRVVQVQARKRSVVLAYALAMPDDLKEQEYYPCRVSHTPVPGDYRLQVHYANIYGEVREAEMTYGHTAVVTRYRKGDPVVARLLQKRRDRRFTRSIRPRRYEQLVAAVGLEQAGVCSGDIIGRQSDTFTIEREDGSVCELSVSDLELSAEEQRSIRPGNRLHLTRDQQANLHVGVEHSYAIFSILPRLDKKSEWTRFDQLAEAELSECFAPGHPRECIYVACVGTQVLLETQPGVLLALPASSLVEGEDLRLETGEECYQLALHKQRDQLYFQTPRARFLHPLATGDLLTVVRAEGQRLLLLVGFRAGPLHLAAEPWLAERPVEQKMVLTAGVINAQTRSEHGVRVEIRRIGDLAVQLRSGLTSFYNAPKMTPLDRQMFAEERLLPGHEVQLLLEYPPELRDGRLRLLICGQVSSEVQVQLPARGQPLDPLPYLRELQPGHTLTGRLLSYDKEEEAFLIGLDDLQNADQERYDCWLDKDQVSFSQVSSYLSVESLKEARVQTFTVRSVEIEGDYATVEVSLKENPFLDVDLAGDLYDWADGQQLKHATYIGPLPALPEQAGEDSGGTLPLAQEPPGAQREARESGFALEIVPGVLLSMAATALTLDGLPMSHDQQPFHLRTGDQLTLRVLRDNGHYGLDIVAVQQAESNILANPRRVIYGRVGAREGASFLLKLEGYQRTRCLLDPDVLPELGGEKLASYDLFRFTRPGEEHNVLYFRPLRVTQLKQGDLLHVQYRSPTSEQSDRAVVVFGNQHTGYLRQRDISYQTSFTIQTFQPSAERRSFEARIIAIQPDARLIFFSLKGLAPRHLAYLLDHRADPRFSGPFHATLVGFAPRNDSLDIELEPGVVLRLPLVRLRIERTIGLTAYDLKARLLPGDVLQLRLLSKQAGVVYLCLTGILKSLLHYLHPGMLVQASLEEQRGYSGYQWAFSLPAYGNRRGELATSSSIDFFPGVFSEHLQFVVQHIPADPNAPLRLRQRNSKDEQQVVRIEAVDVDTIRVCKEDGHRADIYSRNATYRVDERISYLARTLLPSRVLTVTRTTSQQDKPIFSLLANPPAPFAFLPAYLQQRQLRSLELTYVRSEEQDHVFELEPGYLLLIPATALFFYEEPMQDLQRFLPGDVFVASIQHPPQSPLEELRVVVRALRLSVLHHWQPEQCMQARVIETYPRSGGIMVKAGPFETFLSEKGGLLPQHTANTFTKNDTLWVKIVQLSASRGELRLQEIPAPTRKRLMMEVNERKRQPLLAGTIRPTSAQRPTLEVDVLGETLTIQPRDLAWSPAASAREVLLPGEKELWLQLFFEGNRLCVDAKSLLASHVTRYLRPGALVQAYIEKINPEHDATPGKILVTVDGVRTLVAGSDLIWGLPPSRVGVKEGVWLTVRVVQAEQSRANQRHLSLSGRAVAPELEEMVAGRAFAATVRYTLAHGLVFTYLGTPGYIANQDLTWSENALAEELFAEGDPITVYKVATRSPALPFAFSLKHRSQFDGLKYAETVNAVVYRMAEKRVYIQTTDLPANFFVLFSERQADFAVLRGMSVGAPILIQAGEGANLSRLVAPFLLKRSEEERNSLADLSADEGLSQTLESAPAEAVTRLLSFLYASGLLDRLARPLVPAEMEALLARILEGLTQYTLPCTCSNLRLLLGKLDQSQALAGFWEILAQHHLDENDGPMLTVLCRVAQQLRQIETRSHPPRALLAQIYYALGITALLPGNSEQISAEQALEWLLLGYRQRQHVEILLALVLLYGRLQAWPSVHEFLDLLVQHFCQNLQVLLQLPEPQELHRSAYAHLRGLVPGLNMSLDDFASEMQRTVHENIAQGSVGAAAEYLQHVITRLRAQEIEMPELYLNLALCSTFAARYAQVQHCLDEVRRLLEKGENRKRFFRLRLPYAQLRIFLYYQQRKFAQIQHFLVEEVEQGFALWEQTCFPAYLLLAAGMRAASRACMEAVPLRPDAQPERLVLYLYWHRTDQAQVEDGLRRLQDLLFGRLYKETGNWEHQSMQVQVLPDLSHISQFKEMVRLCYEYDVPLYALTRYREMPSLERSIADTTVATQLVDLALRSARVEEAQSLALAYVAQREQTHPMEAARLLTRFYSSLLLSAELHKFSLTRPKPAWNEIFKQALSELAHPGDLASVENEQLSRETYAINSILGHWIKSPYQRHCAVLFAQLLKKSSALATSYWTSPLLRQRLWQVFAASHDYGTLLEVLPKPEALTLEMLEDITFHLYRLRLHPRARRLLQEALPGLAQDEQSARYLALLQRLGEEETGPAFDRKLAYLLQRPAKRQLALSLDGQERPVAIAALEFLVQAPCAYDLVGMRFLLAELLELEGEYARASQVYRAMLCEWEQISPIQSVRAAVQLWRLHVLDQSLPWPGDVVAGTRLQEQAPAAAQLLQDLCTLSRHVSSPQERTTFVLMLGRLQLALATLQHAEIARPAHRRLWLTQIAALLQALVTLPRVHRCFVSLYRVFIGTEPLKDWPVEEVVAVFALFFDMSLVLNFDCDLEKTLKATCAFVAALAAAGSQPDQEHCVRLEQVQQELASIDFWLVPRWVREHPDQIEGTARAVRGFLHAAERRSEALLSEATLALREERELDLCAHTDARWLLTRALLVQGEIAEAVQQTEGERNPDRRDELLLEIFFAQLHARDVAGGRALLPRFTPRAFREAERLLKLWERPDTCRAVSRDLSYLVGKGQGRLAVQCLRMVPDAPVNQLKDEVLYALVVDRCQGARGEERALLLNWLAALVTARIAREPFLAEQLLGELVLVQLKGR